MLEKKIDSALRKEAAQFDRRFKCAIICFAVIEFLVIALVIYEKVAD